MEGNGTQVKDPKTVEAEAAAKAEADKAAADAKAAEDAAKAAAEAAKATPPVKVKEIVQPEAPKDEPAWTKERGERAERRALEKLAEKRGFASVEEMDKYLEAKAEAEEKAKTAEQRNAERIAKAEAAAAAAREEAAAAARKLETERADLRRNALDERLRIIASSVGINDPDRQKMAIDKFTAECKKLAAKDANAEINEREFFGVELKRTAKWLFDEQIPTPPPKPPEVPVTTTPGGEAPKPPAPNAPKDTSVAGLSPAEFKAWERRQGIDPN